MLPPVETMMAMLLADDASAFSTFATQVAAARPSLAALGWHLLTPLVQALSQAWRDDRCDSTAQIVAQGRLQLLLRQVVTPGAAPAGGSAGTALVAPLPGEPHIVGVTFAALALDAAGWAVRSAFPATTAQLEAHLRTDAFDLLHLASSDLMSRDETLREVAACIRAARRASCNPRLVILLSGRAFARQPGLSVLVGADGDGVGTEHPGADFAQLLAWARSCGRWPAAMAAQATLNDVALHIQRLRFGIPEEDTRPQRSE